MAESSTPAGSLASRQLGRYELIAHLAAGGVGRVLLARLSGVAGFQRVVAIKLLHRQYADEPDFVAMLLNEARIAARIHHPNVVSIQEVCEDAVHGYFVVMDYVEGFSLSAVSAAPGLGGAARWGLACRVMIDTLAGLAAAHALTDDAGAALGVVHRDLSPQNILVGADGVARVTDFGVAKAAWHIGSTGAGFVKGKLAYMAPEQARADIVDARADLFAAGVVLWESLAGRRLFKRSSPAETARAVINEAAPPLRTVVPGIPRALDEICARALERAPEKRFESAREMSEALEYAVKTHALSTSVHEAGELVRTAFATQLAERRSAIREAGTNAPTSRPTIQLTGALRVPALEPPSTALPEPVTTPARPSLVTPEREHAAAEALPDEATNTTPDHDKAAARAAAAAAVPRPIPAMAYVDDPHEDLEKTDVATIRAIAAALESGDGRDDAPTPLQSTGHAAAVIAAMAWNEGGGDESVNDGPTELTSRAELVAAARAAAEVGEIRAAQSAPAPAPAPADDGDDEEATGVILPARAPPPPARERAVDPYPESETLPVVSRAAPAVPAPARAVASGAYAPVANVPMANVPMANVPMANVPVVTAPVANVPVANVPVANVPSVDAPSTLGLRIAWAVAITGVLALAIALALHFVAPPTRARTESPAPAAPVPVAAQANAARAAPIESAPSPAPAAPAPMPAPAPAAAESTSEAPVVRRPPRRRRAPVRRRRAR